METGLRFSAVYHTRTLHMSDRSIRRMLHLDLHFHLYKAIIVQKLLQNDFMSRQTFAEVMLELLTEDFVLIVSD